MTSVDRTRASGALRTGLSAGTAFAGGLSMGLVLAALALAAFVVYVPRLNGATGWWPWLLAALLLAMVPLDVFLGVHLGRGRAVARVVERHGEGLAERMAQALAQRIEAMPRLHGALHKSAHWLSADELVAQLAPWTGQGRAVRFVVNGLLKRLPLADLTAQWQQTRAEHPAPATPGDPPTRDALAPASGAATPDAAAAGDPALRSMLTQHIQQAMADFVQPTSLWLWLALGLDVLLFLAGLWLTA